MPQSKALIVSGFGDAVSGGGLFAVEGSAVQRIDWISTMGLASDGRRLARVLRCPPEAARLGEVAIFDAQGLQRYLRLDNTAACHDVAWDGEELVVVSPWDNAVRWYSPGGDVVHEVCYPGHSDSWHINCVTRHEDIWYATVFGSFRTFRAWSPVAGSAEGAIVELESGRAIVSGLTAPHNPRWVDGIWLVCNSDRQELLALDAGSGNVVRRVDCAGWTRGLAYDDNFFYVGTCPRRESEESSGHSSIAVIDRRTWERVETIPVPVQEIYDLTFIPSGLLSGARRGCGVNPLRTAESRQHRILEELGCREPRTLWPSGDPLPWTDFRFKLAAVLPSSCSAGSLIELTVKVSNRSASFFTTAAPAPVYVSYKWLDPRTGDYLDDRRACRTWLPCTIFPNDSAEVTARIAVPRRFGIVRLRVTLVQEGVTWFDDHDHEGAVEGDVEITAFPMSPDEGIDGFVKA